MLDAARLHLLRIIGPNTIGLLSPHVSSTPASPTSRRPAATSA
jgi:acyl-CoA synthetase (NDP forming)